MECATLTASEESVLKKHLNDLKKDGHTWTGYAPSRSAFEGLERDLAAIKVIFRTENSFRPKGRLLFSTQRGRIVLNEGMPFKIVRCVDKGCLFGRDLHKAKKSISKEVNEASSSPSTSPCKMVKLQRTKKKGCTAVMHIKQVELYPEFSINTSEHCSHWQRQKATAESTHRLRLALQEEESTGKPVFREHRFYISMSDKQSHCNHDIDIHACHTQPTNSEELGELLQRGATPVNTMESCLKFYVTFRDNMSFQMNVTTPPDECQNTESPDECQNTELPNECQNIEPPSESQNTESPAVIATQQPDLDLHKALQEKGWFIKRQIRAESQRILSSLYHVHDNAVLERLLCSFMQVRTFIEQSVMKSNGVAARSLSRIGC